MSGDDLDNGCSGDLEPEYDPSAGYTKEEMCESLRGLMLEVHALLARGLAANLRLAHTRPRSRSIPSGEDDDGSNGDVEPEYGWLHQATRAMLVEEGLYDESLYVMLAELVEVLRRWVDANPWAVYDEEGHLFFRDALHATFSYALMDAAGWHRPPLASLPLLVIAARARAHRAAEHAAVALLIAASLLELVEQPAEPPELSGAAEPPRSPPPLEPLVERPAAPRAPARPRPAFLVGLGCVAA